jgi:hypothetical protein
MFLVSAPQSLFLFMANASEGARHGQFRRLQYTKPAKK